MQPLLGGQGVNVHAPNAFRVKWGLWSVCCWREGAGFPSSCFGVPGSGLRAVLEQRDGGVQPFADGSCLCNWQSKEWFQESKTRKAECYAPEKFHTKARVSHGWSLFASARATSFPFYAGRTVEFLHAHHHEGKYLFPVTSTSRKSES